MWGFPYLTVAVGLPPVEATLLLSLVTLTGFIVGPLLGLLSARFPLRRSDIILTIVAAMAIAWLVVLLWPGAPPVWLLIVLIVVITVGGPGSMIGFDYARTYNPARQLGSANGVVNVGGFLASFVMMFLIGVVLDLLRVRGAGVEGLYTLDSFRIAFLVQFPVVGFGVVMLLLTRRGMRRSLREEEGIVVAPLWIAIVRRMRRRGSDGGDGYQKAVR
jgi:sugar phosphate permease